MAPSPHDALFKAAFGQPDIARSELEFLLPPAVRAQIELATLEVAPGSFIDDELRHAHTDLLYTVRTTSGGEALVYVLFEHQSSFDPTMPLRLLRYMVRVWEQWLRDRSPTARLPIVLPVVLHHGPAGWQTSPDFASMLDASPELLAAAGPYLPLFRFVLDDLAVLPLEALASRTLHGLARLVALAFWSSRSFRRLQEAAPLMRAVTGALARDEQTRTLLAHLYLYLLRAAQPDVELEHVRTILLEVAGPQGQEDVVNAAEQLIQQGLQQGLEKGRVALRSAITTILSVRDVPLSASGQEKLASCGDLDTLTRWLARAGTAPSESEVFGNEEGL